MLVDLQQALTEVGAGSVLGVVTLFERAHPDADSQKAQLCVLVCEAVIV